MLVCFGEFLCFFLKLLLCLLEGLGCVVEVLFSVFMFCFEVGEFVVGVFELCFSLLELLISGGDFDVGKAEFFIEFLVLLCNSVVVFLGLFEVCFEKCFIGVVVDDEYGSGEFSLVGMEWLMDYGGELVFSLVVF